MAYKSVNHKILADWVEKAKQGDEQAFAALYTEFSKSIYGHSILIMKNESDANDVVQESMLSLFNNLHKLDNPRAVVAYVHRTAHNHCLQILRKNKRLTPLNENENELNLESDEEFLPEAYVDSKEERNDLLNIIGELTESLRVVIMLYYFNRLSVSDIADILKISETAVNTRLSRAKAMLKEKLMTAKKQLVRCIVPIPVLTRVLHAHVDDVFTEEINISIWQNIAAKLGYAPEVITATTAIVVGTAAGSGLTAGGGKPGFGRRPRCNQRKADTCRDNCYMCSGVKRWISGLPNHSRPGNTHSTFPKCYHSRRGLCPR